MFDFYLTLKSVFNILAYFSEIQNIREINPPKIIFSAQVYPIKKSRQGNSIMCISRDTPQDNWYVKKKISPFFESETMGVPAQGWNTSQQSGIWASLLKFCFPLPQTHRQFQWLGHVGHFRKRGLRKQLGIFHSIIILKGTTVSCNGIRIHNHSK